MRNTPGILWSVLLSAFHVLGTWCYGAVQGESVFTDAAPDWVRPWEWQWPQATEEEPDSEGVRVLLVERQEHPVLRQEFYRSVRLLENESGVQGAGSLSISFDPSYQTLTIHCVRIHRAGKTIDRLNLSGVKVIQPESGLWGDVYTGRKTAILFVEDLRVGDVLEHSYTLTGSNPIIGDHYSAVHLAQTYGAMDRLRVRVIWDSKRPLFVRQHLVEQSPRTNAWGEGLEYVWDWEQVESLDYEDYQPPGNEPHPYVELSDFEGWSRVVEWALPLYVSAEGDLPAEATQLLAAWREGATSGEDSARAALQYVQDELRYTGIELGPDSYRPSPPAQTLAKRYGDCKAKCFLFCTLMHALGVEAWPALVDTASREAVARRLPSPFAFDHVIVKLVLDGQPVWVDPTRSSQGGTLWNRYLPDYRKALVIKEGVTQLEDVPEPGPDQRLQQVTSDFRIPDYDSPVIYTITTVYHGSEADEMREFLTGSTLSEIAQDYLNYNARYYPGITNPSPLRVEDQRERNQLTVVEKYKVGDFWELNESTGQWEAHFYPESLFGMLTDPDTRLRKMPLRIAYPLRREQTVVVHLPDDEWDFPLESDTVEHSAFRLTHRREGKGATVRFHYECETLCREVAAGDVAGYLSKLDELHDILGDTLFRPDDSVSSRLKQINWLMVVLAFLVVGVTAAGGVWIWRRLRTAAALAVADAPPLLSEQRLCGIGGWLILVAIGLVLNPFLLLFNLGSSWQSYFSQSVWQEVAVPQGGQYHPLWAPLLIGELTGNIVLLGMVALLLPLFFSKRRAFPKVYIAFLMMNFLFVLLDTVCAGFIPFLAEQTDPSSTRDLSRATIGGVVWTAYMLKSRRVKLTFVR